MTLLLLIFIYVLFFFQYYHWYSESPVCSWVGGDWAKNNDRGIFNIAHESDYPGVSICSRLSKN